MVAIKLSVDQHQLALSPRWGRATYLTSWDSLCCSSFVALEAHGQQRYFPGALIPSYQYSALPCSAWYVRP